MKAIAAMAENRAIGRNNKLPWLPIKEDFKFFKEFTTNKILIIGSKTFDTLPVLRNRNLVVVSLSPNCYEDSYNPVWNSAFCYRTFENVLDIDKQQPDLICAGGAMIYELFLPYVTEFFITHVNGEYDADTFMPPFEHLFTKQETVKEFDGHKIIRYNK